MSKRISKPKLLLVEGKDEEMFFSELLLHLKINCVEVRAVSGKTRFRDRLKVIIEGPGHENIDSIGIIRDADRDYRAAFNSICTALDALELPVPTSPLQSVGDSPCVTVMILPGEEKEGMLEDICLKSVDDDPAMVCVEAYFDCLAEQLEPNSFPSNLAKAKVRAFLARMEWGEEAHFESIQEYVENQPPNLLTVPKTHAFLASRYKPNLDLGIAAQKGYWQLNHRAFDRVKEFLRML